MQSKTNTTESQDKTQTGKRGGKGRATVSAISSDPELRKEQAQPHEGDCAVPQDDAHVSCPATIEPDPGNNQPGPDAQGVAGDGTMGAEELEAQALGNSPSSRVEHNQPLLEGRDPRVQEREHDDRDDDDEPGPSRSSADYEREHTAELKQRINAGELFELGLGVYRWRLPTRAGGYTRRQHNPPLPEAPEGMVWSSAQGAAIGAKAPVAINAVITKSPGASSKQVLVFDVTGAGATGGCTAVDFLLFAEPA